MTALFDMDLTLTLRKSLYMLSQQSLNQNQRAESQTSKELYILASISEIGVEKAFQVKVGEIIKNTIEKGDIQEAHPAKKNEKQNEQLKIILGLTLLIIKSIVFTDEQENNIGGIGGKQRITPLKSG